MEEISREIGKAYYFDFKPERTTRRPQSPVPLRSWSESLEVGRELDLNTKGLEGTFEENGWLFGKSLWL